MKILYCIIIFGSAFSQFPLDYHLKHSSDLGRFGSVSETGIASNLVIDIKHYDDNLLFFGTGDGLSFADITSSSSIQYGYFTSSELPRGGNPALTIGHGIIAVSGVVDSTVATGSEPKGTGIAYSKNGGESWSYLPQPVDSIPNDDSDGYQSTQWGGQNDIKTLAVTTDIDNVSYDIAVGSKYIYTANWAGGLRRYNHLPSIKTETKIWEIIPLPQDGDLFLECDSIDIINYEINPKDPDDGGNHNHKGFSVYIIEDTIWVGTANGINKGIINGDCIDWMRHYKSTWNNISGDWVIGFTHQEFSNFTRLWAITWAAEGTNEKYALSYTDDGGESWHITSPSGGYLKKERIFNLYGNSKRIWAASGLGLYVSEDGNHWEKYLRPIDEISGEELLTESVMSVYFSENFNLLWTGTEDGISISDNDGISWTIHRFWEEIIYKNAKKMLSVYPNPFLINDYNQVDGDGHVRFIYSNPGNDKSTIDIFDFAMDRVVQLGTYHMVNNTDSEVIWNGRNEYGDEVSNGVYFCRLSINGEYYWTKLAVVN